MTPSLVVVGGGIAGLAAAWEATGRGARVTVLEAGERLGGKLRTSDVHLPDGRSLRVDEGADAFLARVPDAVELCGEVGLADELTVPAAGRASVLVGGRLLPLPRRSVLGVPYDPEELAVGGLVGPDAVRRLQEERGRPPGGAPAGDVAIGPFLRERFGDEVVDRLVAPLVGGINAGDVDRLSLRAVTPQLAEAAAEGGSLSMALERRAGRADPQAPVFHALRGGSERLVEALVDALVGRGAELSTGAPVGELRRSGGRWHVGGVGADAVVVATGAPAAARLLRSVSPAAAGELAAVTHSTVALVTLVWRAGDLRPEPGTSGFLVPSGEGLFMTAASFGSNKWTHWDDGEHVVVRASAGRVGDERVVHMSDEEVVAALRDDLRRALGVTAPPVAARVSRWPQGFAQYEVGHLERVARIEAALSADCPGVAVAGAAYRGVGIPACIRQGRSAAAALLEG